MSMFCKLQTQHYTPVPNVAPATLTGNAVGLVPLILMIPTRASIYNSTTKLWKLFPNQCVWKLKTVNMSRITVLFFINSK
jgi:hypothetical protein